MRTVNATTKRATPLSTTEPAEPRHDPGGKHHEMTTDATRPQLAAVTGVTALMLLAALIVPGFYVNLALSAHDVGPRTTTASGRAAAA